MATKERVMNKKKKFVNDGLFLSELNEFFQKELAEDGYSGCEVRSAPKKTEIVIKATSSTSIIGQNGRRINELTSLVRKRFGFEENKVELYVKRITAKGLCAIAQAEALKYKLLEGLAVRRAAYAVLRQVMNAGAKGCEVVISGKLRAARAKSMKFSDGFMIHSGQPTKDYIDRAVRHVMLRQGVLGVKVKIMLPHNPTGHGVGPSKPLPDIVIVQESKDEGEPITEPRVQTFETEVKPQFPPTQQPTSYPSEQQHQDYPRQRSTSPHHRYHAPSDMPAPAVQTDFSEQAQSDSFAAPDQPDGSSAAWM